MTGYRAVRCTSRALNFVVATTGRFYQVCDRICANRRWGIGSGKHGGAPCIYLGTDVLVPRRRCFGNFLWPIRVECWRASHDRNLRLKKRLQRRAGILVLEQLVGVSKRKAQPVDATVGAGKRTCLPCFAALGKVCGRGSAVATGDPHHVRSLPNGQMAVTFSYISRGYRIFLDNRYFWDRICVLGHNLWTPAGRFWQRSYTFRKNLHVDVGSGAN